MPHWFWPVSNHSHWLKENSISKWRRLLLLDQSPYCAFFPIRSSSLAHFQSFSAPVGSWRYSMACMLNKWLMYRVEVFYGLFQIVIETRHSWLIVRAEWTLTSVFLTSSFFNPLPRNFALPLLTGFSPDFAAPATAPEHIVWIQHASHRPL